MLGGAIGGPLYDYGYLRALVLVGSILVVFGMLMTSLCTEYWQIVLAQGIVVGIGNGCLFIPCIAVLPTYFLARRSLAIGISASGSSIGKSTYYGGRKNTEDYLCIGGVLFPIIFHELQPRIGFGWTTRVIALIMLATLVVPISYMRMRVKPAAARRLFDLVAWTEWPYVLYTTACFFGFLGLYIPFFYIQLYSTELGNMDPTLVFYLVPLLNAGSMFGRLVGPLVQFYEKL